MYDDLERKNREAIKQAWAELNPLNNRIPTYSKSLIDLFDDFFSLCVDKYPELFLVKCKDLGVLTRCRKGCFDNEKELLPPSVEIAEKNQIINRWNPPGKRYLYAAHSQKNLKYKGFTQNEYTCFKEMRAQSGVNYTFADFKVRTNNENKYIINMDYDGVKQDDIEEVYDELLKKQARDIVDKFIEAGKIPTEDQIRGAAQEATQKLAVGYIGKSFLRPICQTIFTAIDDDKCSTGAEREKAYKAFHILAEYLEKRNISGVIYPSTRTALDGAQTQNIVVFNVEEFMVISGSLRTYAYREFPK